MMPHFKTTKLTKSFVCEISSRSSHPYWFKMLSWTPVMLPQKYQAQGLYMAL